MLPRRFPGAATSNLVSQKRAAKCTAVTFQRDLASSIRSVRKIILRTCIVFAFPIAVLIMHGPVNAQPASYPSSRTTGVPADVALKPSKGFTITRAGTVVDGLNITGSVIIEANDVTLKNCKITSANYWVALIRPGVTGARIENCEISNQGRGGQGIAGQGTFVANNIHDCADGIDVRGNDTVIRDNYIHRMRGTPDSHYDGIQADGGFSNLVISHNTIINDQNQTSAVMIDNYWGPIDRVRIDNNLLAGGGYTVYINEVAKGQRGGGPVTRVSLTNNQLRAGVWGTLDLRTELGHRPIISGNVPASAAAIRRATQE